MNNEPRGFFIKASSGFFRLDSAVSAHTLAPGPSMLEIRRQIMRKLSRSLSQSAPAAISPEHLSDLDVLNHSTPREMEGTRKDPS